MGLTFLLYQGTIRYNRVPIFLIVSLILPISFEINPLNLVSKSILSLFRFSCFALLVLAIEQEVRVTGSSFCFRNKIVLNFVKLKLNLLKRILEDLVERNKFCFILSNILLFLFNNSLKLDFLMFLPFQQIIDLHYLLF